MPKNDPSRISRATSRLGNPWLITPLVFLSITLSHALRVAGMDQPDPIQQPFAWLLAEPRIAPVYGIAAASLYLAWYHTPERIN